MGRTGVWRSASRGPDVRFVADQHTYDQMAVRHIVHSEIEEALANITRHQFTPEHSTRIEGMTLAGRTLKVWIVGTRWPPKQPIRIKSVAPKGRSR
jgi:hypothetical protein